eukprot:492312-Ditylum_brightwellii.AAC.2
MFRLVPSLTCAALVQLFSSRGGSISVLYLVLNKLFWSYIHGWVHDPARNLGCLGLYVGTSASHKSCWLATELIILFYSIRYLSLEDSCYEPLTEFASVCGLVTDKSCQVTPKRNDKDYII